MTELVRWGDDRLDDLAATVKRQGEQLAVIADLRNELTSLRGELRETSKDAHDCINAVQQLDRSIETRAAAQATERKSDRRWMVGTFLTTASLIIAALAIFLG